MTDAINIRPTFLVAHDFSACADAAADLAVADLLATKRGGRIVLVHVVTLIMPPVPIEGGFGVDIVGLERAANADAQARLDAVAKRLRAVLEGAASPPIVVECVTRLGVPAEGILAECDAQQADRIIIGTHGRTGVSHWLLGSVAERVARRARVPVLIAHVSPQQQQQQAQRQRSA